MQRFLFIIPFFSLYSSPTWAQDAQFSQYYSAPLYLNPGLAGITQSARAGFNYRNQWPAIPASFETFSAYVDNNFDEQNSSVGLILTSDRQGLVGLRTIEVGLQYAYQLNLDYKWRFRPAVQLSYTNRRLDFSKLVFGDQISNNGLTGNPTREQFNSSWQINYFDIALGSILYSERIWLGVALHHLRRPNHSFLNKNSPLSMKLSIHGGYNIPLRPSFRTRNKRSLTPTFNFRTQGKFDQLDLGLYFTWEPMLFGLWYRGLPLKRPEGGGSNNESIVFMLGVTKKHITLGYSFDYTLSGLGIQSGGAHEVSLTYTFRLNPRKPSRDIREVPCPVPMVF